MSSDMENKELDLNAEATSVDDKTIDMILSELENAEKQDSKIETEEKTETIEQPVSDDELTDEDSFSLEANNPLLSFLAPVMRSKEEIEGDKRKKKRIILISLIAAAAVLVITLVLLLFVFPKEEDEDYEPYVDTSVTLFDKTDSSVKCTLQSVTFQSEQNNFKIINQDGALVVEGYADLTMHALNMEDLEELLSKMVAANDIGEVTNLKEYGLTEPQITITAVYHDGSQKVFLIGDKTPLQTGGYYMCEKDSNHVYILTDEDVALFMLSELDFISSNVFTKPTIEDSQEGTSDVVLRKMTLGGSMREGKNFSFRLVTSEDSETYLYYNYIITEPYLKGANSAYDSGFGSFTGLSATSVVKTHPTAAELKEYGFDNPYSVLTFTLAKRTTISKEDKNGDTVSETTHEDLVEHTLRLCKIDNDNYYATIDDKPIVYLVAKENIPFAEIEYDDLADTLLFLEDISQMSTFKLTVDGKVTEFKLTHNSSIQDNAKNMTVKVNGKTYDTMDFRYLIQNFMEIKRYTSLTKDVSNLPVKMEFSIYHTGEKTPALTVKFHETSGNLCAAVLSNGEKYQVKTSDVEFVIEQFENYLNGKTVLR